MTHGMRWFSLRVLRISLVSLLICSGHALIAEDTLTASEPETAESDNLTDDGAVDADAPSPAASQDTRKEELQRPWIGVVVTPVDDALRAQIDIPDDTGLLVRRVTPDSPAAESGLRKFDVLLRADKNPLANARDLSEIVQTWDNTTDGIKLEWIHKGEAQSRIVTPAEYPGNRATPFAEGDDQQLDQLEKHLEKQLEKHLGKIEAGPMSGGQPGMPRFFRILGPGVQQNSTIAINDNGLKIRIERNNREPARITVEEEGSQWIVTENDMNELPEHIQPRVKKLLEEGIPETGIPVPGNGMQQAFQIPDIPAPMIDVPDIEQLRQEFRDMGFPKIDERFDEIERKMQEMLQEIERLDRPVNPLPQDVPNPADLVDPNRDA